MPKRGRPTMSSSDPDDVPDSEDDGSSSSGMDCDDDLPLAKRQCGNRASRVRRAIGKTTGLPAGTWRASVYMCVVLLAPKVIAKQNMLNVTV
jgi:hypothetical protein